MKYPEQNSTNFPIEITEKLKEYRIPKGQNIATKFKSTGKFELFSYQKLLEMYMAHNSPYRGILLYHTLGSGKTITAINVAEALGHDTVVLLPKSLQNNFIEEVITFVPEFNRPDEYKNMNYDEKKKFDRELYKKVNKKYKFVSSNSGKSAEKIAEIGVSDESMGRFIKGVKSLDNKLLIIDEVHNLMVNVINASAKNGSKILNMIMNARNLKLIFLSGSPVVSDPFELGVMFNMLRGFIPVKNPKTNKVDLVTAFPENYEDFNKIFLEEKDGEYHIKNKEIFQERIVGLVSYYDATLDDDREIFPEKLKPMIVNVPMSDYQWKLYVKYRAQEQDEERKTAFSKKQFVKMINKKPKRQNNSTFRTKTRQLSDFALPEGIIKSKTVDNRVLLKKISTDALTSKLPKYGPKIMSIMKNINKYSGNVFVYSQFVSLEGIGVLSRVMELNKWNNFNSSKTTGENTFAIFSGDTSDNMRKEILSVYNLPENKNGDLIRVLLATATAAEGINLKNVRQVHIVEPYWHANRLDQVIGRAIRTGSHKDLPKKDREVQTFIYLSVAPKNVNMMDSLNERLTTDQYLFFKAEKRKKMLNEFLGAMKEMAIDCQINSEHNNLDGYCRICAPTNETMYPSKLDDHLLPFGSRCGMPEEVGGLTTFVKDGVEYKKDKDGNVYKEVDDGVFVEVKLT